MSTVSIKVRKILDTTTWIDAELAVDRYEDEFTINLQQARALAKEAGIDDYSSAVLNAITRMEIEGVEYRQGQLRIPVLSFKEWSETLNADNGPARMDAEAVKLFQAEPQKAIRGVCFELIRVYFIDASVAVAALSIIIKVLSM